MDNLSPEHRKVLEEEGPRWWDLANERLRISVAYAQSGIKALFLANGGGILSLLTFAGNVNAITETEALYWSFVWFGAGITAALATYIAGYVSQSQIMQVEFGEAQKLILRRIGQGYEFSTAKYEKVGAVAEGIGLSLAVSSLFFFIAGAFVALDAIT